MLLHKELEIKIFLLKNFDINLKFYNFSSLYFRYSGLKNKVEIYEKVQTLHKVEV